MTFDIHPDPPTSPLTLEKGAPSELIAIEERAAVDPVTGRNTMRLAVVKLGVGCSAPGPPHPTIQLQVNTGPLTTIGDSTQLSAGPGDAVAIASLVHQSSPELHLVEIELLRTGLTWRLRIQHDGPADRHQFVWVVADDANEVGQPWMDAPVSLDFAGSVGLPVTRTLTIANRGTGTLVLTDPDGADLGHGFVLDRITPDAVAPNACATAEVTFTGPGGGTHSSDFAIATNDSAAGTAAGHNGLVRLTATVPILQPGDIVVGSRRSLSTSPEDRLVVRVDPATGQLTRIRTADRFDHSGPIAVEPTGNVLLIGRLDGTPDDRVVRLSRTTGRLTRVAQLPGLQAITVESDGTIVVAHETGAFGNPRSTIVRINPVTGAPTLVSEGDNLKNVHNLTIDRNGEFVATAATFENALGRFVFRVIRIRPSNGAQTKVSEDNLLTGVSDIVVEQNGRILVADDRAGRIIGVNPSSGAQQVVSEGQLFGVNVMSFNMALENDQTLLVTQQALLANQESIVKKVVRVKLSDGKQRAFVEDGHLGLMFGIAMIPATLAADGP